MFAEPGATDIEVFKTREVERKKIKTCKGGVRSELQTGRAAGVTSPRLED